MGAWTKGEKPDLAALIKNYLAKTCSFGSILKENMYNFSVEFLPDLFSKKSSQEFLVYQFLIDKKRFICYQSDDTVGGTGNEVGDESEDRILSFSIVLVSNNCVADLKFVESSLIHFGKVLSYMEEKDRYLSRTWKEISDQNSEFISKVSHLGSQNSDSKKASGSIMHEYHEKTKNIKLFQILKKYFNTLNLDGPTQMEVFPN